MSFSFFSRLPKELRLDIWGRCNPVTTAHQEGCCNPLKTAHQGRCNPPKTAHLTIREEDYEVLSISPPPALHLTNKEARSVCESVFKLKPFPIWKGEDWTDLVFDAASTPLEIAIQSTGEKKAGEGLNVTWTELAGILGDALYEASRIHVVCGDLRRLERLWMEYREGEVLVGEAVGEEERPCFSAEALALDREVQLQLHPDLVVTASSSSFAVLEGREVFEWRVERDVEEEVMVVAEEEEVVEKSKDVLTLALLVELGEESEERWTDTAVMEWADEICVEKS